MSIEKDIFISTEIVKSETILSMEISFPEWLQKEIDERGWSWNKLSEMAGLSSGTIYNIKDGTRGVGENSLSAIAKALKMPQEEVFRAAGLLKPRKGDARAERLLYQIEQLEDADQETVEMFVGALLEKRNKKNTVSKSTTS